MSDSWSDHAAAELAVAGYRRGGARQAVIELLDAQRCALSAVEIEDALRSSEGRSVARASIYRILEELERLKLVSRIEVGQSLSRFEPIRADHHHHHMVCDRCGQVLPFADAELERSIAKLTRRVEFRVSEHDVVLHGSCAECT
jgi:Fur family ferric uptake transcriptional regulator